MKSTAKSLWTGLSVVALFLAMATIGFAQTYTATVTGNVTDQQGAAVANAKVTASNQGTKLDYTATTSDTGVYTIPFLPVGNYVITVEASGFKKIVSNEIKLEVNQTARINLALQVGGVSDTVNVTDVAPVLQTESVTVGGVISGNTTTALPLNGRNFQQLTLLVPGTINPNPGGFNNPNGQGRPYVNGNREQGNAFLLDGISVDETIDNRIGYKPNIDAIAEFRVETSNSSAEFGNVTGATVNATMKSGTNEFHGNVFEFIRNEALDANSWAANRNNQNVKSKLRQNIFGGTLGGPIIKERLFFFAAYQQTIQRTGGAGTASVAPIAWRSGNLSAFTTPIRDPQKTGACTTADRTACFTGNIIPANRISNPVAKALFADNTLYPLPTRQQAGTGVGLVDVVTASQINNPQIDGKIDWRVTDKDNFSSRYSFMRGTSSTPKGALPTNITGKSVTRPQNIALNWTRTISPTVINEARVGFNRAVFISEFLDWAGIGNGNSKFGIPGNQVIPGLSFVSAGNGVSFGSRAVNEDNVTNTFHYGDNLTILRGRHSLKMGGQWQRYQQNRFYPGNNGLLGGFTYDGRFTGLAFADFLLDLLSNKSIGSQSGTWGHRQNRIGVFFQDDFKVRNNLTLNLGMRWEYTSPVVEVKDRQSNFDLITKQQIFANQNGNSRALYNAYYKGFEPRVGFAWTPTKFDGKFVIRGGYGITQYMEGTGSNLRLPLNPPLFSEADQTYDATTGAGTITRGFTDVIVRNTPAGNIRVWNPDLRPQFTQQWNLALEYQLTPTTSLSASYVGHKADHLVAPTDWNQPLPGVGAPSTWASLNSRRPFFSAYPFVTQISGTDSWARSNYHGLQVFGRQRLTKGFEFLASYTLSKTMTDNLGYYGSGGVASQGAYPSNNYDRRRDYGRAFFDARHNFVWSGTYDLPVGKGRSFGSDWNPVVNGVLGGWGISSIVSMHTGFPITVQAVDVSLQGPRGGGRPNLVGDWKPANQTIDAWLNPAAFVLPAQGTFGNSGVGIAEAPGYVNWDFGVGKKFYVSEGNYIDFRAEFFNFTNTPSFSPPARNFSDLNTFGRITGTVSPPRNIEFALKYIF
ncbi:MAG: TonB-dependent receptor [Acidobacteriota bacterium]|nr:TonB-dependent receptor [Acidobacteriota bacterium]